MTYSSGVCGGTSPRAASEDARFAAAGTGGPQRKKIESMLAQISVASAANFYTAQNSVSRKLQISRRDTPRSKQEGRIRAKRARPCPKNVKKKPQRGLVYQNRDTQEREVLQSEAVSKKKSKRRGNAGWCIKLGTCEKKYRENLAQVVDRFGAVDGRA